MKYEKVRPLSKVQSELLARRHLELQELTKLLEKGNRQFIESVQLITGGDPELDIDLGSMFVVKKVKEDKVVELFPGIKEEAK